MNIFEKTHISCNTMLCTTAARLGCDPASKHRADGVEEAGLARSYWSQQQNPRLLDTQSLMWLVLSDILNQLGTNLQTFSFKFDFTLKVILSTE